MPDAQILNENSSPAGLVGLCNLSRIGQQVAVMSQLFNLVTGLENELIHGQL